MNISESFKPTAGLSFVNPVLYWFGNFWGKWSINFGVASLTTLLHACMKNVINKATPIERQSVSAPRVQNFKKCLRSSYTVYQFASDNGCGIETLSPLSDLTVTIMKRYVQSFDKKKELRSDFFNSSRYFSTVQMYELFIRRKNKGKNMKNKLFNTFIFLLPAVTLRWPRHIILN